MHSPEVATRLMWYQLPSLPSHGFMNAVPRCVTLLLLDVNCLCVRRSKQKSKKPSWRLAWCSMAWYICTIFFVGSYCYLSQCSQYVGFRGAWQIQTRAGNEANACADPPGWGGVGSGGEHGRPSVSSDRSSKSSTRVCSRTAEMSLCEGAQRSAKCHPGG